MKPPGDIVISFLSQINSLLECMSKVNNDSENNNEYFVTYSARAPQLFYNQKKNSLINAEKGDVFIIPYFISCTYDIKIAKRFSKDYGYTFILLIKSNEKYINVTKSSWLKESEIILPPGKIIIVEKIII